MLLESDHHEHVKSYSVHGDSIYIDKLIILEKTVEDLKTILKKIDDLKQIDGVDIKVTIKIGDC